MTDDERVERQAERDFLLRSIEDLDREYEVGDVDDDDYQRLRDSYVARAADVLRLLGATGATGATGGSSAESSEADEADEMDETDEMLGTSAAAGSAPRRRSRSVVAASVAGVIAVAVLAGILVAQSSGERLPGQVASGNVESDSVSGLLARARSMLNPNDPQAAIDLYGQVLEIEPDNVEALTYLGWLSVLSARSTNDDAEATRLVQSGLLLLRQATTIDEDYADPHCFIGITFARFIGDEEAALASFDRCLALDPPSDTRQLVEPIVAELRGDSPPTS